MRQQLLACSNCVQGAADRYWWVTGAAAVISVIAFVVLLIRLRAVGSRTRAFGLVAVTILAVGLVLSLRTLSAGIRVDVDGITIHCGSALTAAKTKGMPDDSALDRNQLGCRRAGRQHLDDGLPIAVSVVVIGFLATGAGIAASLKRQQQNDRPDQAVRP